MRPMSSNASRASSLSRLCDHLEKVSRDYDERRGVFSGLSAEAAARVIASWGEDARRQDDPRVEEVRQIRRKLADTP